jgi:hypothetical protein
MPKSTKKASGVKGNVGKQGDMMPIKEDRQLPQVAPANQPYYKVYESYKKDAEEAVVKENVPPGYKEQVKKYFESLNPTK